MSADATQDHAAKVDITFTVDTRPFEKALRKARRQLWWYSVRRRVRRFFHA